jgi:hypothetical protein
MESEARSTLRNGRTSTGHHDQLPPKPTGHRSRALSQSDIRGIRLTSDYDSEAELHHSGHNSRDSPNSSGNGSANQLAPENNPARGSSQLREMLQSPFHTWGRHYRPVTAENPGAISPRSADPTSTSTKDGEHTQVPYSFKRTIKERFKEELRRGSDPEIKIEIDDCSRTLGKRRPDSRSSGSNDCSDIGGSFDSLPGEYNTANIKRRASEPITSTNLPTATVPIFALHSSGAYYVPSSLHPSMISFDAEVPKGTAGICHPVTINVNFSTSALTQGAGGFVGNTLTVPGSNPLFPRPIFQSTTFMNGQLPFMQGAPLPSFVCPNTTGIIHGLPGNGVGGMVMPIRRASLTVPVGVTLSKDGLYGCGGLSGHTSAGPVAVSSRTSPHILNLSQPHTRL